MDKYDAIHLWSDSCFRTTGCNEQESVGFLTGLGGAARAEGVTIYLFPEDFDERNKDGRARLLAVADFLTAWAYTLRKGVGEFTGHLPAEQASHPHVRRRHEGE